MKRFNEVKAARQQEFQNAFAWLDVVYIAAESGIFTKSGLSAVQSVMRTGYAEVFRFYAYQKAKDSI
jgi:hypothetical protein